MGLFRRDKEEVVIGDQRLDLRGLVEKYNELLEQFDQVTAANRQAQATNQKLREQLAAAKQPQTDDRYLTLLEKYRQLQQSFYENDSELTRLRGEQSQAQHQTAIEIDGHDYDQQTLRTLLTQYQRLQDQVTELNHLYQQSQTDNQGLQEKLSQAADRQLVVNGQAISPTDLVTKYRQVSQDNHQLKAQNEEGQHRLAVAQAELTKLKKQLARLQALKQPVATRSTVKASVVASQRDGIKRATVNLIDRYYDLVQAVLSDYQDRVKDLQSQLAQVQLDPYSLKLAKHNMTAKYYRQVLTSRNDQMIRYVENHGRQEKLVNQDDQEKNVDDNLRGIRYWGNFLYRYRKELGKLLKANEHAYDNFKYAYHEGKDRANVIRDQKPLYLDAQNATRLQEIYRELGEYKQWKATVDEFSSKARSFLLGVEGEQLVNNVVGSYSNNHVLYSLNLPYEYYKGQVGSNQIDLVTYNSKGIFIIEVKNYTTDYIGINEKGYIVTSYDKTGTKNDIVKQGKNHYWAVYNALANNAQLKPHMGYLKHQIHTLYVSVNPHAAIQDAPNGQPYYHFVDLDGLRREMDKANGNLRPEIIQAIGQAFANAQQVEKEYPHYCFPENPTKVADAAWHQFELIRQLNALKLDDLVKTKDSQILADLDSAGLKAVDGYVTSKRHGNNK